MGELPPLHTPQGPGVPRAFRPGFPRVDSSGTSSAPSSRSTIARFTHLLSPRAFPPPSRSPLPSPSFRPVLSTVRYSFLHGSLRSRPLAFPSSSCPVPFPFISLSFPSPFPFHKNPRKNERTKRKQREKKRGAGKAEGKKKEQRGAFRCSPGKFNPPIKSIANMYL